LKQTFDNILPEHIDEDICRCYARERTQSVSPATAHYELGLVRQAMNWAMRKRLIDWAPHIFMPQKPPPRDKRLTKAQFREFLKGCASAHVQLFATLAICTGARSNAILDLTWDRVDFDNRLIDLRRMEIRQTNKGRAVVPMNDKAFEALQVAQKEALTPYVIEWAGEKVGSVKKAFQRASERSGIECTPHMLRHSAATWMAEDSIPMAEIAQYLGHESTRVTEKVYARYSPTYLRRASEALNW
jgi:integrase